MMMTMMMAVVGVESQPWGVDWAGLSWAEMKGICLRNGAGMDLKGGQIFPFLSFISSTGHTTRSVVVAIALGSSSLSPFLPLSLFPVAIELGIFYHSMCALEVRWQGIHGVLLGFLSTLLLACSMRRA